MGVSGCELGFTVIDVSSGSLGRRHGKGRREGTVEQREEREEREQREQGRGDKTSLCVCACVCVT